MSQAIGQPNYSNARANVALVLSILNFVLLLGIVVRTAIVEKQQSEEMHVRTLFADEIYLPRAVWHDASTQIRLTAGNGNALIKMHGDRGGMLTIGNAWFGDATTDSLITPPVVAGYDENGIVTWIHPEIDGIAIGDKFDDAGVIFNHSRRAVEK